MPSGGLHSSGRHRFEWVHATVPFVDGNVPFTGDDVRHQVSWKDEDAFKRVSRNCDFLKLQFLLDDAEIFTFAFG